MEKTAVSFPGLGLDMNIDRVAFSIFGIDVYWYGLCIAFGILMCVLLASHQSRKLKFSSEIVADIILVALPAAVVGARLYYVACEWDSYKGDIKAILDIRSGGLAVYGGILGAVIAVLIMCKIRKIPFSTVVDFGIVYIPLGQAIGRWGNFFNQEAFGTTTNLPWGMTSAEVVSYLNTYCPNLDSSMPVHPTFLYESLGDFAIFALLLLVRKYSKHDYETACGYMIGYGTLRFFIEGIRTDSLYLGSTGIRTSQLLSFVLVLAGLIYVCVANWKNIPRTALPEKFILNDKLAPVPVDAPSAEAEGKAETDVEADAESSAESEVETDVESEK